MKPIHFLLILRSWSRSALSSVISIASLTVGLVCATILLLFVVEEYRTAHRLGSSDDIYYVETARDFEIGKEAYSKSFNAYAVTEFTNRFPEIEKYTNTAALRWKWNGDKEVSYTLEPMLGVSKDFPKLVNIKLQDGSTLESLLSQPNQVAITQSFAAKYFPDINPIGQTLTGESSGNIWRNGVQIIDRVTLSVAAIIEDSEKSFLKYSGIFLRKDGELANDHNALIIKLNEGTNDSAFCRKVQSVIDTITRSPLQSLGKVHLTRLKDVYFNPEERDTYYRTRNKSILWIGLTIALAILVIAAFNYINITMVRAPRRLKNLAGQRIMGASKNNIRAQIFADTSLNVLVAFAIAITFMEPAMNAFNSFMSSNLALKNIFEPQNLFYIIGLLVVLIALPALNLLVKLNIKNPLETFKNPKGRKLNGMQALVVAQFVISVALIAFSLNVGRQMNYVADTIEGGDRILMLITPWSPQAPQNSKNFYERVRNDANTLATLKGALYANIMSKTEKTLIHLHYCDPNFFDFIGVEILQGRTFDSLPTAEGIYQAVINETFIRHNEITGDPIGYEFEMNGSTHRVVGVCRDIIFANAQTTPQPTAYSIAKSPTYNTFMLKFTGSNDQEIKHLEELYAQTTKDTVNQVKIQTVKEKLIDNNPEIKRLRTMVWIFTIISIILTAAGMFGLSWYTVERRRKEIAVRKIHGATTSKMIGLLTISFLKWVLIASLIALPTAYYISGYWLESFVTRTDNSLIVLLLTTCAITTITFLTVIFQTIKVASTNPANAIKAE